MSEKKPYSDRRWTDIPKCIVIGHEEITEEEEKMVDDFIKEYSIDDFVRSDNAEKHKNEE